MVFNARTPNPNPTSQMKMSMASARAHTLLLYIGISASTYKHNHIVTNTDDVFGISINLWLQFTIHRSALLASALFLCMCVWMGAFFFGSSHDVIFADAVAEAVLLLLHDFN